MKRLLTIALLALMLAGCGHHPSQWEIAVQKVAHNGDTTGVLWDAFMQYDALMVVNKKDDLNMDGFMNFYKKYLPIQSSDRQHQAVGECERWAAGQYEWAWDYYGTSVGFPTTHSEDIHWIPVKWWRLDHAK